MNSLRQSTHLVTLLYEGHAITYRDDGWFNATEAAAKFDRRPNDWLDLPTTKGYIEALERRYQKIRYVKTSTARSDRGGGTWLHPKLAVRFAQWLNIDFAIWCDEQIDNLIHGKQDWGQQRHAAVAGAKMMSMMLEDTRKEAGKDTAGYHYSNEHLMLNKLVTGERKGINRDSASIDELNALAKLQIRNALLIGRGLPHHDRQETLSIEVKTLPMYARLTIAPTLTKGDAAKNRKRRAANDPGAPGIH